MYTIMELADDEFGAFCQQEYDEARRFLKNCGKPQDVYDRALIDVNRNVAQVFGRMLHARRPDYYDIFPEHALD